ncbi:MAG: FAD-dependent oxidoreductase [Kouleothrix sp.]|nr:FAD-dependent oxidoreductase [Kouleothrix sp.]
MPKTIIVGGGLAGLATAVKLLDAGVDVELIEKRDVLGGKTSSWTDAAGDHIESGLHCYFRCYKELLPFFRHVGVYDNIRWKEHTFLVARPGGDHAPALPEAAGAAQRRAGLHQQRPVHAAREADQPARAGAHLPRHARLHQDARQHEASASGASSTASTRAWSASSGTRSACRSASSAPRT